MNKKTFKTLPLSLLPFIYFFLKDYKKQLCIYCLLSCLSGFWNPFNMLLVSKIITILSSQHIVFHAIATNCLLIFINFIIFDNITWRSIAYTKTLFLPDLVNNMEQALLEHTLHQSNDFFQKNMIGEITKKIFALVDGIHKTFTSHVSHFLRMITLLMITLYYALKVNYILCILLFLWIVIFFMVSIQMSKKLIILSTNREAAADAAYAQVVDSITNNHNVRLFANQEYELNRRHNALTNWKKAYLNNEYTIIFLHSIQGGMIAIMLFIVMTFLLFLWQNKSISVGEFSFIIASFIDTGHMMWWTMSIVQEFYDIYGRCKESFSKLMIPITINNNINAISTTLQYGSITFQNVSFHYYNKYNIFNNLFIRIEPNSKIGIVGSSGSGKSTFINLISRTYDIQKGKILLDNFDIKELTLESLRQNITIVSQDTSLFNRTILENIAYGKLYTTKQDIQDAAKKAYIHEFIETLPEKYNTIVGDRGINLSGGQKQRISLARAFLKNSKILILDESTSALDSVTETHIQRSILELMTNKTTIVIAHRLSTIIHMNRIIVFDNGEIVGDGSHEELLQTNHIYQTLWINQIKK